MQFWTFIHYKYLYNAILLLHNTTFPWNQKKCYSRTFFVHTLDKYDIVECNLIIFYSIFNFVQCATKGKIGLQNLCNFFFNWLLHIFWVTSLDFDILSKKGKNLLITLISQNQGSGQNMHTACRWFQIGNSFRFTRNFFALWF